ncbi:MAG: putative N6-adenine-specific DNA methylase [Bacteroidetes bacterium]|nr:MAG: putative N6-adenine-specific DNA methylase [Bacteroidota bacterium]
MFSQNKEDAASGFRMVATTMQGLSGILAQELLKLGARDIEEHNRAVSFFGDKGFMYKANLSLRTALRVLLPVETFEVHNEEDLYNGMKAIDWEQWLGVDDTLAVDCSLNTPLFNHTQYIAQKTKDAIVDRFRDKYGKRPSVDLSEPTLRINVHVYHETCTVSLDSSGDSLHKRGYRDLTGQAPLNETLAAGMVMLTGWDRRSPFMDPMCGSGTLLIEAALYANNIPPGIFREKFGFERWKDFDEDLWHTIHESQISRISSETQTIIGSDMSQHVVRKARENVKRAKVDDVVKVTVANFHDLEPPEKKGVMVINPPYGERMHKEDIEALYKSIGDTLKKKYSGWEAWLISSNMEALKKIGLRHSRRITLFNAALECKFLKFELYAGTKKIHKLENRGD